MPEKTVAKDDTPEVNETNIPVKPSTEFLDRAKSELDLRVVLRQEYESMFKIWKNTELSELEKRQEELIAKGLLTYFEKWKEEQKPPEPEDIQILLNQDYETFSVKVDFQDENQTEQSQMFTIRELPQSIEKKFYKQFKEKLMDKLQMLEALSQSGIDKPFEDKVRAGLSLLDESFDVMAQAVVYCLNPFGHKSYVTIEWVQSNISSNRQWTIVEAQMKVNRLRDFFSKVSLSGQNMMTMRRPNFQALQQLAV